MRLEVHEQYVPRHAGLAEVPETVPVSRQVDQPARRTFSLRIVNVYASCHLEILVSLE